MRATARWWHKKVLGHTLMHNRMTIKGARQGVVKTTTWIECSCRKTWYI